MASKPHPKEHSNTGICWCGYIRKDLNTKTTTNQQISQTKQPKAKGVFQR